MFMKACARMRKVETVIVLDTLSMALPVVVAARLFGNKAIVRVGGDFVWEQYVERTKEKVALSEFYEANPRLSTKERLALWLQRKVVIPLADALVFSTEWQRSIWASPYRLSDARVNIIENAYLPNVSRVSRSESPHAVVWIGRDIVLKNVSTLDRAVDLVRNEVPNFEYEKYSSIAHKEVIEVLGRSRVLVIPSISEVSPNLVLEALALQVPVLLTRDCGLARMLEYAVTLVDPLDAEDIASHIREIMTEEGYRVARERAASFVSTRTYSEVADEFLLLL